jgi:hypothetical protein
LCLLLACVVSVVFGIAFFGDHRELFDPLPKLLRRTILTPGMFCLYVVGTFTGSAGYAFAAFVVGTFAVYAAAGLTVDAIWWAAGRCRSREAAGTGENERRWKRPGRLKRPGH